MTNFNFTIPCQNEAKERLIDFCMKLDSNFDMALYIMGICYAFILIRGIMRKIGFGKENIYLMAIYETSLPELLIFISFIFLAFTRLVVL